MKSPRDLLLSKHRQMGARLDAVRGEVLQGIEQRDATPSRGFAMSLWHELFWSCRRVWFVVAGAWLLIAVLNLAAATNPQGHSLRASIPESAMANAATQRELLRAELLGSVSRDLPDATPAITRPRSERRHREMVV
jgi:hypothetical protein